MGTRVEWVARFLDWTQAQRCRACGASLGDSRVVLVKGENAAWRADLRCRACRSMLVTEVDQEAYRPSQRRAA